MQPQVEGPSLLAGVYTVCGSKGDDVRLGTGGAREHKPIRIKDLLMLQN